MHHPAVHDRAEAAASPPILALQEELRDGGMARQGAFALGDLSVEVCAGRDSLWCLIRRPGRGGLALRAAYFGGAEFLCRKARRKAGEALRVEVTSVLGRHLVSFTASGADLQRLQVRTQFTPAVALRAPPCPRDLYPLGPGDDPMRADGRVEAAQRGLNTGLVYFRLDRPAFGSVLYLQDLTCLNDYFRATGTRPDGVVGGTWPELGYLPPTPESQEVPEAGLLPEGKEDRKSVV